MESTLAAPKSALERWAPLGWLAALVGLIALLAFSVAGSAGGRSVLPLLLSPEMPVLAAKAWTLGLAIPAVAAVLLALAARASGFGRVAARIGDEQWLLQAGAAVLAGLLLAVLSGGELKGGAVAQPLAAAALAVPLTFAAALAAGLLALRADKLEGLIRSRWLPWAVSAAAAALYASYGLLRHAHFRSGSLDLGSYLQTAWLYSQFKSPINTLLNGTHALGDHFAPLLAIFSQLRHLLPGPAALLVGQAAVVALGGIAVHRYALRRTGRAGAAAAFQLMYLLAFATQSAVEYDFHALTLAGGILPWALYLVAYGKDWQLLLVGGLLLATKDHVSGYVAALGAYAFLFERRRVAGPILFVAGGLWLALIPSLVMPLFLHYAGPYAVPHFSFGALGNTMPEVLAHLVRHPLQSALLAFDQPIKFRTVLVYLGSVLLLPVFRLRWLVVAAPMILERFWSQEAPRWGLMFHYGMPLSVVTLFAAIDGLPGAAIFLQQLLAALRSRFDAARAARLLPAAALVATVLVTQLGVRPHAPLFESYSPGWRPEPRAELLQRAVEAAQAPAEVSVTGSDALLAHLAERDRAYHLKEGLDLGAEVVALDLAAYCWPYPDTECRGLYCRALLDSSRIPVFSEAEAVVLARPAPGRQPVELSAQAREYLKNCQQ